MNTTIIFKLLQPNPAADYLVKDYFDYGNTWKQCSQSGDSSLELPILTFMENNTTSTDQYGFPKKPVSDQDKVLLIQ